MASRVACDSFWDRAISGWVIASCDCFEQEYGYVQFQFVRDRKDVDDFNVVEYFSMILNYFHRV